jgi:hypothetical protein
MLIAIEKRTVSLKNSLNGIKLKELLNILTNVVTAWPDEGSLKINFIATCEKTTVIFNGASAEALELLEKYPYLVIRLESLSSVKIAWKNIKVVLKDVSKMNAQKMELEIALEIETESENIEKTKKMTAAVLKYLETV